MRLADTLVGLWQSTHIHGRLNLSLPERVPTPSQRATEPGPVVLAAGLRNHHRMSELSEGQCGVD